MEEIARSRREALCQAALEAAEARGARYVEARFVDRVRESLAFRDGALNMSVTRRDVGIGIRALVGQGWGYGATNVLEPGAVARAAERAARIAPATERAQPSEIEIPPAVSGTYQTPMDEDPFEVSLEEKAELYRRAHEAMHAVPGLARARASYMGHRTQTTLLASNGSVQDQAVTLCGGGISGWAEGQGEVQCRSLPKGAEGQVLQGGFELLRELDLERAGVQAAEEAVALLEAEPMPEGPTTLLLDGSQLSLQIHESVGHPTELDRVLGEEISLAGASFALPHMLDGFRYGSEIVNLTADATSARGPGTFGFDDEGTPATSTPIVREGRFVGYLSGRDQAARLGRPSGGALRAESWSVLPIVRMINLNLEPGSGSLDDLIADVDEGVLLSTNKSWSIDDLRLNFQFSCEIAYEIRGGKRTGRVFKKPVYHGITPQFWRSCSAIAGPEAWGMWGWIFCGKGDPAQLMHVGHGCAPARFDGVHLRSA